MLRCAISFVWMYQGVAAPLPPGLNSCGAQYYDTLGPQPGPALHRSLWRPLAVSVVYLAAAFLALALLSPHPRALSRPLQLAQAEALEEAHVCGETGKIVRASATRFALGTMGTMAGTAVGAITGAQVPPPSPDRLRGRWDDDCARAHAFSSSRLKVNFQCQR